MKKFLGFSAVALLALVWSAPEAEARRCWWDGYAWVCKNAPRPYWRPWAPPPPAYLPPPPRVYSYYRPYYRPYW